MANIDNTTCSINDLCDPTYLESILDTNQAITSDQVAVDLVERLIKNSRNRNDTIALPASAVVFF